MTILWTPEQIEAEHEAALSNLTPSQWAAVDRWRMARTISEFTDETTQIRLKRMFKAEAERRNAR